MVIPPSQRRARRGAVALVATLALTGTAAAAQPAPETSTGPAAERRAALDAAVAQRVGGDGLLPLADGATCPVARVAVTFERIPAEQIELGGYIDALVEPGPDGTEATGIATCDGDPRVVTGFDAFWEDGAWTVHALPVDDHAEDEGFLAARRQADAATGEPGTTFDGGGADELADSTTGPAGAATASSGSVPVPPWPAGLSPTPDPMPGYDGQDECLSTVQPGTRALGDLITNTYPTNQDWYSWRACGSGGKSEHKEGRALDWFVNAYDASERALGDRFTRWLTEPDPFGNPWGGIRRMGIMYIVWNQQTWGSWNPEDGWRPYTGSSPHTDHVHISLSWPGARCETTFWQATSCTGDVPVGDQVIRLAGADRIATAVRLSEVAFGRAATVIVARADDHADALAASSLAFAVDAPLLLTHSTTLPSAVAAEIDDLGATKAYVVGGSAAVSDGVVAQLDAIVGTVERLGGSSRLETAAAIADEFMDEMDWTRRAILVRADDYPDALAATNLAEPERAPILLTSSRSLPAATAAALRRVDPNHVWAIGGTGAIADSVLDEVRALGFTAGRIAGADRYETSRKVAAAAENKGMGIEPTLLASGRDFPDALAAGPAAVGLGGRLLLANPNGPSPNGALLDVLAADADAVDLVNIAGGSGAIDPTLDPAVLAAIE